jgi:multidrug efflux pump subunit AcrB
MFSEFFIRRPIVACVLSILIVLMGAVAWRTLPWRSIRRSRRRWSG